MSLRCMCGTVATIDSVCIQHRLHKTIAVCRKVIDTKDVDKTVRNVFLAIMQRAKMRLKEYE